MRKSYKTLTTLTFNVNIFVKGKRSSLFCLLATIILVNGLFGPVLLSFYSRNFSHILDFKNDFGNIVVVLYSKSLYIKVSLQKWLGRSNLSYKPFFDVGLCIEASARCFAFAWETIYRIVGGRFFANEMLYHVFFAFSF